MSGGRQATGGLRLVERVLVEVEGADVMPRLCQVRGHAAAHVAQADEGDACH